MPDYSIISLRVTEDLDARITALAARIGKSKQETMRLCMEIGANWIKAHGYDLEQKIVPFDVVTTLKGLLEDAIDRLTASAAKLESGDGKWKITEMLGPDEMAASRAAADGPDGGRLTSESPEYQTTPKPRKKK